MGRLFVVLVIALAGAGTAAIASASGRHPASRTIVCPLGDTVVPCCGPPVDGAAPSAVPCCPATVNSCQPTLSIAASPDPMTAGAKVTISGTLTHSAGAGTTVQLWQKLAGAHSFSKDGTATTDVSGNWSMSLAAGKVMTNRSWYAVADGLQSSTISEPVSARIVLHARATKLYGLVSPVHARERVALQRLSGRRWVTVERVRLTRRSSFSFRRKGVRGSVRVLLASDKENALSVSKKLVLS